MGLVAPGMWDLSGPGIKPVSPALAGGFLANVPRGKSLSYSFESSYLPFSSFLFSLKNKKQRKENFIYPGGGTPNLNTQV